MAEVPVKQYFRQAAVPVYQGSVAQRPILQQPLTVKATENDFGAQVGKGMQSLGEGLGKMAEVASKLRDLQADTTAKDSKTAFERAKLALEHGENGYLNTSGQGAVEGYPGYEEALAKLQKTFEPKDPLAAGRYEAMVAPVVTTSLEAAIKHKAQGQKEWVGKAAEGRLSLAKDQAIAGYNKPEQINSAVASGVNEIYSLGKLNGWTPEVIVAKAMDFITGLHTGVAMTMAGKPGGATAAMEYLKANSAQVDPNARADLENKIRPLAIDEKGKQIALEIVSEKRTPAGASDDVVTGAVDKASPGKAGTGSGKDAGTRGGADAAQNPTADTGKDTVVGTDRNNSNPAEGADAKAQPGQTSTGGVNGAAEKEPQRGGPTRAKAFLVSISAKPDRPGDALPLDNALAENTKALIEDAPEDIRKGLGVSFVDPKSRASVASASSVSSGRSIQLTYEGRPLDQAPAQVLDWLHDNAEKYHLRFPFSLGVSTDPALFGREGSVIVSAYDGVAARTSMISEAEAISRINQIADADLRAASQRHLAKEISSASQAEIAEAKKASDRIWTLMQNGTPLSQIPVELKIAIGEPKLSALMEYEAKADELKTDPVLYSKLSTYSRLEPVAFAKLDLTSPDFINRLSRSSWKELQDRKNAILADEAQAERDGTIFKEANEQAKQALSAAGLTIDAVSRRGTRDMQAEARREMQERILFFQQELQVRIQEFRSQNNGRRPDYVEMDKIISHLLVPIVITTKSGFGWFTHNDNGHFLFEANRRKADSTFEISVAFDDIPHDVRETIRSQLRYERMPSSGSVRPPEPTEEEIVREYIKFVSR